MRLLRARKNASSKTANTNPSDANKMVPHTITYPKKLPGAAVAQAVIAEIMKPITAAVAVNGMNFGALRISTSAVLVFSVGLATKPLNQR